MIQIKDGFKGEKALVIPRNIIKQACHNKFLSQLYITDIGFYPNARNHYRHRELGAQEYILICCIKGSGWVEFDGRHIEITANRYFILPANIKHTYSANDTEPWTIYWIHFNGTIAHTYYNSQSLPAVFVSANGTKSINIIDLFEEIYSTLQNGFTPQNMYYATSCLFHFLGILQFNKDCPEITQRQSSIVQQTIALMKESITQPISSQEIAVSLGYSYSHLSALFSKSIGCSPYTYIIRLKMQQACQYLDFSDMKVNEIANLVGIADPYYFSRLFRKNIGVSPTVYRRQIKG